MLSASQMPLVSLLPLLPPPIFARYRGVPWTADRAVSVRWWTPLGPQGRGVVPPPRAPAAFGVGTQQRSSAAQQASEVAIIRHSPFAHNARLPCIANIASDTTCFNCSRGVENVENAARDGC